MSRGHSYLRAITAYPNIAAAFAVGGCALWMSAYDDLARVRNEHASTLAEYRSLSTRVASALELERELGRSLPTYSRLVAGGVLGTERRREWIEFMNRRRSERRLYDVKYAIEPQRALGHASADTATDVEIRASRAELDFKLLHEGDLIGFLSDLRDLPSAWFLPRACTIRRAEFSAHDVIPGPRLHALCSVDFVTLHDRKRIGAGKP